MNLKTLSVKTDAAQQLIDITATIRHVVRESGVGRGVCHVFVPHTTAAVTINENTDPDVREDILEVLESLVPSRRNYRHSEGNAHAHVKAALIGSSLDLFVEGGQLVLGTWQSIFFCEFDGPRTRSVLVRVIPA